MDVLHFWKRYLRIARSTVHSLMTAFVQLIL